MKNEKKILTLHVKAEYFDAIKSGEKKEEFRRVSTWQKRLNPEGMPNTSAVFDEVVICRGYPKKDDTAARLSRPWRGYVVKEIKHPHFGAAPVWVFAITVNE